ncbi:MAG: AMP-binding protein [Hyphomicrobiaceae bacterium]
MRESYNRRRAPELSSWSIPQWFLARCAATPGGVAFRYKDQGLYQEVTWRAYRDAVEAFLAGLEALGLERGERVAAMSDPCREFFIADMAGTCGGAICYGIYTTCSVAEVEYQLENGGASYFLAENQEFVDKALQAEGGLRQVRKIIVFDTRALFQYRDERLISFEEVVALGRERLAAASSAGRLLEERAATIKPHDIAVVVYTSGTTGPLKGAMHDHASLMWGFANAYLEAFPELNQGVHRAVSHLPVAHLIERSMSMHLPLVADVIPHIGEEVEDLMGTLYEVQPTFINVVPRILEKIASQVVIGMQRSSYVKRLAYAAAMRVGERYRAKRWAGQEPGLVSSALYGLATHLVFRQLLKKAGLSKIRTILCAGAPLPQKIQETWEIWGVNVRNLYGITEGGYVLCQRPAFPHPAIGGAPIFPREVRLGGDGELMVRGPGLFRGYWRNDEGTLATMQDEWLTTGDIAEDNGKGEFRIVDRKKDIMITSGGKNIAPSEIENQLKSSPYISEAALVGDGRKFVTALIEIDFGTVSEWARQNKIIYSSFQSLVSHEEIVKLIGREIEEVNEHLARVEQVKKFRILPKELDPEEGDTTPTRKIKRKHLYVLFGDLIEGMYAEVPAAEAGQAARSDMADQGVHT